MDGRRRLRRVLRGTVGKWPPHLYKGALTSCFATQAALTLGRIGLRPPGEWASALAIYHCSMKPIARASGRSAVASAAYRAGVCLTNERDGITHDFTRRDGVEHSEIVLPEGVSAEWALDRSALWNAAELAEKRKDARVAREFEIALPHELSQDERLETARAFARDLADWYGAAVDFSIHAPHQPSDVRNHHAHVMMTTRQVAGEGSATRPLSSGRTNG